MKIYFFFESDPTGNYNISESRNTPIYKIWKLLPKFRRMGVEVREIDTRCPMKPETVYANLSTFEDPKLLKKWSEAFVTGDRDIDINRNVNKHIQYIRDRAVQRRRTMTSTMRNWFDMNLDDALVLYTNEVYVPRCPDLLRTSMIRLDGCISIDLKLVESIESIRENNAEIWVYVGAIHAQTVSKYFEMCPVYQKIYETSSLSNLNIFSLKSEPFLGSIEKVIGVRNIVN